MKFVPKNKELENNIFLLIIKDSKIKKITFMNDFDQSVIMIFNGFKILFFLGGIYLLRLIFPKILM